MRRPAALSVTDRPAGTGGRGIPALDGVRALAVLAVLADHAGVPGLSGGFVGVDVFFVLSGFLITSLLLDEHRRTGRVDLGAFWARRARRLLPALTVLVAAVALGRRLFAPDSVGGLRYDALSALGWVANWRFAAAKTDYFAQGGAASPLQHTWSLGVEEQYYLVWPLVLTAVTVLLAHRSRASVRRLATLATVGVLATVGAIASAAEAVWLSGNAAPGRVYFGSDTRAQALLAGAAAAAVFARRWPLSDGPSRPAGTRKRGQLAAAAAAMAGLAAGRTRAHCFRSAGRLPARTAHRGRARLGGPGRRSDAGAAVTAGPAAGHAALAGTGPDLVRRLPVALAHVPRGGRRADRTDRTAVADGAGGGHARAGDRLLVPGGAPGQQVEFRAARDHAGIHARGHGSPADSHPRPRRRGCRSCRSGGSHRAEPDRTEPCGGWGPGGGDCRVAQRPTDHR